MVVPKAKKLPSGNWFIQLRLGGESISITEPTEKRCVQQAQMVKAEYLAGKRAASVRSEMTLSQAIDKFIALNQNVLSPATVRGYRTIQKNRFQDLMACRVDGITQEIAQRSVNAACKEYSAKTVRNSWLFIAEIIYNQTGKRFDITLPQVVIKDPKFLDADQIKVFLVAVKDTKYEIPALLALCSLRRSELLALQWKDIDVNNATVTVRGAMVPDDNGEYVFKSTTKNQTSRRVVPIMPRLAKLLRDAPHQSNFVVTLTANSIFAGINRICKNNDLPQVGLHGLRHSFASLAYSLGMSEKITMEIGGWADDATMKKIYTHVARADRLKAENAMKNFYEDVDQPQG